jgi:hypothetical protein
MTTTWPDAIEFHGRTWWRCDLRLLDTAAEYTDRGGWSMSLQREESLCPHDRWFRGSVSRLCVDAASRVLIVSVPLQTLTDALGALDTAMTEVGL